MIDFKIQYLGFPESDFVTNAVWDYIEHLEKIYKPIMSCNVIISHPHHKKHKGGIYHVKIRLHMAGGDIIIDRESENNHAHEDVYVAIRDAFDSAKRKLEDFTRVREGRVKEKAIPQHARIIRILDIEDCGFILDQNNREIYFHRNALLNGKFEDLKVGQEVRYSESMGEKGPQVSSMQLVGHSGHNLHP